MVLILILMLVMLLVAMWLYTAQGDKLARLQARFDEVSDIAIRVCAERDFYLHSLPANIRVGLQRKWQQHLNDKREVFHGTN